MASPTLESARLAARRGPLVTYGLSPPAAALVAASAAGADVPIVVVVPTEDMARAMASDLRTFLPPVGDSSVPGSPSAAITVAAPATSPYAELSADHSVQLERITALYRLVGPGPRPRAFAISAASLARKVMPPAELLARSFTLTQTDTIPRDELVRRLLDAGYRRSPVVEDPGTFAVRGGVVDVFAPLYRYPVRVELFGDEIESLRAFDPTSQRTLRALETLTIHPARDTIVTGGADVKSRILAAADAAAHPSKATRRLLEQIEAGEDFVGLDTLLPAFHQQLVAVGDYLPDDAQWLIVHPDHVRQVLTDELEQAEASYAERIAEHRIAFAPEQLWLSQAELDRCLDRPRTIEVRRLEIAGQSPDHAVRFSVDPTHTLTAELDKARRQKVDRLLEPLAERLRGWHKDGWRVAVATSDQSRADRLRALLADYDIACEAATPPLSIDSLSAGGPLTLIASPLSSGFALPADRLAILSDDDIFGKRRTQSRRQKQAAKRARQALLGGVSDFSQLSPGDFLVHRTHGIGQYQGLAKLPVAGTPIDFLHLTYDGGQLYLPVYRVDEVQRYVGADGQLPKLDKLGGITWERSRKKAARDIRALAEDLLRLYAQRAALPGRAFPPPDAMFRDFEATFPFEETPDQQTAIDDVLRDMETERPMDRLVCGDVGYGKTEVALRAILKAVLGGTQAALLAPTTVLVEQHYQSMVQRFAGWPITVGKLSRFQSKAETTATLKDLASGRIDAVVGTHRLLSNDVRFKELGLIVIDEEQRFGVAHKERLKRMRTQLDVLTLTATPIPRTLHLSMTGLRDLSIIATPPADRRAIRTLVARPEDSILREGIRRELGRAGQVFFVVPRISGVSGDRDDRTLEGWAEHLRRLIPEARVATAHGQMPAATLEKTMVDFVAGNYDILVCTTIVESGLDIARANTMFVARADRLGLAQMYQLRGRIGRSRERAFCYLLLPAGDRPITDEARRRLEALQRYSDLGAGFLIASHDLELRGAGELFGKKQSGSIAAVGFDTYTALLEEAVAELKGEHIERPLDPEINVDVPGFIPDDYVSDTGQRLDLYKRLASAADESEVRAIIEEMVDRYGQQPDEVDVLADLMVLKALARALRAQSLELTRTRLSLALAENTPLEPSAITELISKRTSGYSLTPDMRLIRTFTAEEQSHPAHAAKEALGKLLERARTAA